MHRRQLWTVMAWAGLWLTACNGGSTPAAPDSGTTCVPDRATWDDSASGIVQRHCGSCHGAEPQFGAPFSLTDYDTLVADGDAGRISDRMVARLMDHTMPPVGSPHPPDADMEALAQWASCGSETPDPAGGLVVSAPPVRSPVDAPPGLDHFDFTANDYAVGPDELDHYQCFVMDFPGTDARLIKRFEIIIDDARVLHHAVLLRDPDRSSPDTPFTCFDMPAGSDYLYAWAPGQSAIEFPEGGLRIEPGERLVLQIHYNNGAHVDGVTDSSGVRIFHGPVGGTEYGMASIGPLGFSVPARSRRDVTGTCTWHENSTVFAGIPHMHEIGSGFEQYVLHPDGTRDEVVSLTGWSFETQLLYDTPVTLAPGDKLITTCEYDNTTDHTVNNGFGTGDEMCFNFMYITPPPPSRFCDETTSDITPLAYTPGACAPAPPLDATPPGAGTLGPLPAPDLIGGSVMDGSYVLEGADIYLESLTTPVGMIDPAASSTLTQGQMSIAAGHLTLDALLQFAAVHVGGFHYEDHTALSFGGSYTIEANELVVTGDCPAGASGTTRIPFEVSGDSLTVSFTSGSPGGGSSTSRLRFKRLP